jgi:mycofactocin precursor
VPVSSLTLHPQAVYDSGEHVVTDTAQRLDEITELNETIELNETTESDHGSLVEADLLVEEVSIDGMCGVF